MPPTLVRIPGGVWLPDTGLLANNFALSFTNLGALSNSTDVASFIFRVPKAGVLESVAWRLGIVTTPQDLEVSFRNVVEAGAGTGYPDGTADQYYVIPSASLVASGWNTTGTMSDDGTGGGVKRTVAQGDLLAVAWRLTGAGNVTFQLTANDVQANFPYNTLAGWMTVGRQCPIAIKYDDGTYAELDPITYPWIAGFAATSFHSGTTPDQVGNRFVPTITHLVNACWLKTNATANYKVVLYDAAGAVLTETGVQDADTRYTNSAWNQYLPYLDEVLLTAGETYRRVITPTTAAGGTNLYYGFEVSANAVLAGTQEGAACYMTERTDGGAWTDTTTKRLILGHRMSAVQTDPGTGGGGGAHAHAQFGV